MSPEVTEDADTEKAPECTANQSSVSPEVIEDADAENAPECNANQSSVSPEVIEDADAEKAPECIANQSSVVFDCQYQDEELRLECITEEFIADSEESESAQFAPLLVSGVTCNTVASDIIVYVRG
jgi:hypothetical protein